MRINKALRLEMFQRVRQFNVDRVVSFPAASHAGGLFVALARAIDEIEATATTQVSGAGSARGKTTTRDLDRSHLLEEMEAINRTGRAISLHIPGVAERFHLPASEADQALLTAARAFARDAAPLKEEFTKRGLAATFIEDLEAAITEFEDAISERHSSRESHVAATAAIDAPFERGMAAVRELRLIMPNLPKGDSSALAAWTSASHVERHSSRKGTKAASAGASPEPGGASGKTPNAGA